MKDWMHLLLAITLAALGFSFFVIDSYYCFSIGAVLLTDMYALSVLVVAARRSDDKWTCTRGILPTKTAGIFVVFALLTALVSSFAGMYLHAGSVGTDGTSLTNKLDVMYFSFGTITTLGYGDYSPLSDPGKWLVMFELGSGLLLLFCIFPLLISRLSQFDS